MMSAGPRHARCSTRSAPNACATSATLSRRDRRLARHLAEDALELIEIDYAPLDAISSIAEAFQPGRPLLWEKAGSNVVYDHSDSYGDVTRCSPLPTGSSPNGCRANVSRTSRWRPAVR